MSNIPQRDSDCVSRFFDYHSAEWGKHYSNTGFGRRVFNSLFRRGLKQRWEITMKYVLPAAGKTYLDIGCGTGDYSLALAGAGADKVVGIDFASSMIDVSRGQAAAHNLAEQCEFVSGDFMTTDFAEQFDVAFAIGVFDYLAEYELFWQKMISHSQGLVIGSFPGHSLVREPLRKRRYRHQNVPVFFYSETQLTALGRMEGLERFDLIPYSAGYALIGFVA